MIFVFMISLAKSIFYLPQFSSLNMIYFQAGEIALIKINED